jgi:hypothetical protein
MAQPDPVASETGYGLMLAMTQETDWLRYEPVFAVCTNDGKNVREPVMRRKTADGKWEYRCMSEAEQIDSRHFSVRA